MDHRNVYPDDHSDCLIWSGPGSPQEDWRSTFRNQADDVPLLLKCDLLGVSREFSLYRKSCHLVKQIDDEQRQGSVVDRGNPGVRGVHCAASVVRHRYVAARVQLLHLRAEAEEDQQSADG